MKYLLFLIVFPGVTVTALLVPFLAFRWFVAPDSRKQTEWLLVGMALVQPAASLALLSAKALSRLRPLKLDLFYLPDRLLLRFSEFLPRPACSCSSLVGNPHKRFLRSALGRHLRNLRCLPGAATGKRGPASGPGIPAQSLRRRANLSAVPGLRTSLCLSGFSNIASVASGSANAVYLSSPQWSAFRAYVLSLAHLVVSHAVALGTCNWRYLSRPHDPVHAWQRATLFI